MSDPAPDDLVPPLAECSTERPTMRVPRDLVEEREKLHARLDAQACDAVRLAKLAAAACTKRDELTRATILRWGERIAEGYRGLGASIGLPHAETIGRDVLEEHLVDNPAVQGAHVPVEAK